ncbi:MAG TPA: hypothetical protein VK595_02500 [Vicinamibacterales bacterium]|nr:hypothetical protein [Vicinamibacterales bacterium]
MAIIAKSGTPSLCTDTPCDAMRLPPLPVGEDIGAGDACYIKSDGKIMKSTAAAATAPAEVHGFAPNAVLFAQRQTLSLYSNVNFNYGAALTPGAYVYLSAVTAGAIDGASSANQLKPIGFCVDATRIRLFRTSGN